MQALAGLRVLVTRPAHQAASLLIRLEDAGAQVQALPLLEIAPAGDAKAAGSALRSFADADYWIFTSANAVNGAAQIHAGDWPVQLLALGQGTVRALAARGHHAIAPEGGGSEDLLLWPALTEVQNRRVLIVTGDNPRSLLAETLRARGAVVGLAHCYRRQRIAHPEAVFASAIEHADVLLLSSGEGLAALLHGVPATHQAQLRQLPLLLPSERVAAEARQAGFVGDLLLPTAVSDAATVARLEQWRPAPQNGSP